MLTLLCAGLCLARLYRLTGRQQEEEGEAGPRIVFQYTGLLEVDPAGGYRKVIRPPAAGLVTWGYRTRLTPCTTCKSGRSTIAVRQIVRKAVDLEQSGIL